MAKPRFTNEQIAEILQQSKEGASNKELCEHYQFSVHAAALARTAR